MSEDPVVQKPSSDWGCGLIMLAGGTAVTLGAAWLLVRFVRWAWETPIFR